MTKKKQIAKSETKKVGKPKAAAEVIAAAPMIQAEASAPTPKAQREERNGVRRPKPGGKCDAVWTWLDANPTATAKEIREAAPSQGWNLANAMIELSVWRKFNGIAKPKPAAN